MRVLFVTRGWPTKDNPMPGNYEAVQAKALARKGVEVTVLNYRWHSIFHIFKKRKKDCFINFIEDGVRVIKADVILPIVPYLVDSMGFNYWGLKFFIRRNCRQILSKFGPFDIVHAHIINMAYSAVDFKKKCGLPLVITEHWSELNNESISPIIKRISKVYKSADSIITVSQALADSLYTKFGLRSRVIHNMVPDSFFNRMLFPHVHDKVHFISVGALRKGKKFDILIKAFALAKQREKCQLVIIGDGEEREHLVRCIIDSGLQNQVTLAGLKKPDDVSQMLSEADCFALTSQRETFGIVYIEAMAKGLPVIATLCGGPESFVNKDNGILVTVEDIQATANAIDYMVEHLKEYDHKKIQQYCYENFSQNKISEQIISVYNEVIKKCG